MSAEDATINPDGSATFEESPPDPGADAGGEGEYFFQDTAQEGLSPEAEGIDPAFYLLGAAFAIVVIYFLFFRPKKDDSEDDFFAELDGDKVSLCPVRAAQYLWLISLSLCKTCPLLQTNTIFSSFCCSSI